MERQKYIIIKQFQSTHSRGVRRECFHSLYFLIKFQSTHSRGVRHFHQRFLVISFLNFNPRTREECDSFQNQILLDNQLFQSTHSRGVRRDFRDIRRQAHRISIHALARSATREAKLISSQVQDFNPRTREECDWTDMDAAFEAIIISIHALARSATFAVSKVLVIAPKFQSTHSRGVRQPHKYVIPQAQVFQSTHSRGVRLDVDNLRKDTVSISIHALARSATCIHQSV